MRRPRFRSTVRRMIVGVIVAALAISYVASYHRISRRGLREAPDYGIDGFFYVPIVEAPTREGYARHLAFITWYAPLNWLDRLLFGGRPPASCFLRLSG